MGRVVQLAGGPMDEFAPCPLPPTGNRRPYYSLIPLPELLGEVLGVGSGSKRVVLAYSTLIRAGGSELSLLLDMPLEEIAALNAPGAPVRDLAKAIARMRHGEVSITPGFDGVFGVIRATGAALPRQTLPTLPQPAAGSVPKTDAFSPQGGERKKASASVVFSPEQKAVIESDAQYGLVIAGPGSGKTAVLAERIARLLQEGVAGSAILAVSFTVKAAGELRERVISRAGDAGRAVRAVTFHSFCAELLREETGFVGAADFTVLDDEERDALLDEVCAGSKVKGKKLGAYIEEQKRRLLFPGEDAVSPILDSLYAAYERRLRQENQLDFDSLVTLAARLLRDSPEARKRWQAKFQHIFVDEYQDVNFAQYTLLRLLTTFSHERGVETNQSVSSAPLIVKGDTNRCMTPAPAAAASVSSHPLIVKIWVIGDPNQAIYGFRGADSRFIQRFEEDYPGAARFTLTRSFRCPAQVADAAGALLDVPIEGNANEATLFRAVFPSAASEAEAIARRIAALIGGATFFAQDSGASGVGDAAPDDCAVLVRTLLLSRPIIEALDNHGVPYILQNDESRQISASGLAVGGVRVMTIHAAKGLEFAQVFVPALEDGLLPFTLFDKKEDADTARLAEEKRLLYVAMTRAKVGLYLSRAQKRVLALKEGAKGRLLELPPSPFLSQLETLVPLKQAERQRPKKRADAQIALF
jgi:DNA helicase-2/ATP-dependent DNA helicase PcrA